MSNHHKLYTRLTQMGKKLNVEGGKAVNPPVIRASTVAFDNMAQWHDLRARRDTERLFTYGAKGTPTTFALEDAITELEGGHRTRLVPTGLAAIAVMFLAYLRPGDHVLLSDACYGPVRNIARDFFDNYGIEYTWFSATGKGVEALLRPNTRMIYTEVPGSLAYEMADIPALVALARPRNILVAADNTWGSGVLYRPLELGADISVMAATKYLCGHSDVVMGSICTTENVWQTLAVMSDAFGMTVSPDDAWLVLRGIRTLRARLEVHQRSALEVARALQGMQGVGRVFCPALPDDPGHALWQRDCHGTNGLLSFELTEASFAQADAFLDYLKVFSLGASWGGYESLASLANMQASRTVDDWSGCGPVIRLHIGLEAVPDLLADIAQAMRLAANGNGAKKV